MSLLFRIANKAISYGIVQRLFRFLNILPAQYLLLLKLLETLSERQELFVNLGLDRTALGTMSLWYFVFSGFFSLFVLSQPSLWTYSFICLVFTMLMLFVIIISEAANTLMNPLEATALAHHPINGATYNAAKLTHLLRLVAYCVPALNLLPALSALALKDSKWFFPLTHLTAAYLAGIFVAFLVCGIYGWLFRFVPAAKLKNIALWIQVVTMVSFSMAGQIGSGLMEWLGKSRTDLSTLNWFPPAWYVSVAMLGHQRQLFSLNGQAMLAIGVSLIAIVFGLRSFSEDYLRKVFSLTQSTRRIKTSSGKIVWIERILQRIQFPPTTRAAFSFIRKMALRDWHFRRQILPIVLYMIVFSFFSGGTRNILHSPFTNRQFCFAYLMPQVLGFVLLNVCAQLPYTDQHRASWLFMTVPMEALGSYIRGIYWSLWLLFIGFVHIPILLLASFIWGIPQAFLFLFFSVSLNTFFLGLQLLLLEKLPFTCPPKPSRDASMLPIIGGGFLVAGIIVGFEWFLFRSQFYTLLAAVLFAFLSFIVAQYSLKVVEAQLKLHLKVVAQGFSSMFRQNQ